MGDFATVAVAAQITLDQNGACEALGLGLTAVGPKNLRANSAEAFLRGKTPDAASIKTAAQLAAQDSSPTADLRGSVEYKRDMVRVLTIRALTRSAERAQAA